VTSDIECVSNFGMNYIRVNVLSVVESELPLQREIWIRQFFSPTLIQFRTKVCTRDFSAGNVNDFANLVGCCHSTSNEIKKF